ncbi:response regulator transcription factor [Anaerolentibacter hominis]|uniref:response regulator transcription factor n=1 Tax=Anaerolentibacter hominis TaxID=3079009 RepID=UPI0031B8608F
MITTTVLIVEDEKNIGNFIATTLAANDYKTITCTTGKEALSIVASHGPDLILLDLGLPDIDGIEVLKSIRSWSLVPIIVISARTQEEEKVLALDLGADDYISKPFGSSELLARIRTALRHTARKTNGNDSPQSATTFQAQGLFIDFEKYQVFVDGTKIHLTQIEFKLISLLARNSGKVMTYDSIIIKIWGPYAERDNQILRVNMANIRRKIEQNPADPKYIFTEVGVGYRMIEEDSL